MRVNALISAEELNKIIGSSKVKILDGSYGLPDLPVRIGAAQAFDIDAVADPDAALPHTLPAPGVFARHVGKMGISNDDLVVVYDRGGMHMAAARVWWMFRVFGHDNVRVLDGGLPAWVEKDFPLTPKADSDEKEEKPEPTVFNTRFRPELFKQKADILGNLDSHATTIIDARDPQRYSGVMAEPRPGMESGHIPGSHSLFFASLIDPQTGLMKSREDMEKIIASSRADITKPVAISCGSGVTACIVALALYQTGHENAAVYGGSWAEWGSDAALPKNKGFEE